MAKINWLLLLALSVLLGWGIVQYLVCSPIDMSFYLFICLAAVTGLVVVIGKTFRRKLILPVWIALILIIASYLFTNTLFLNQEIEHPMPELTRNTSDVGIGHTAVIYFTHGESQGYSPNAWLETMHHLDDDGVPFVPKPFRPFFFNGIRSEYLLAGGSLHNYIHEQAIARLASVMKVEEDPTYRFYLSFLDTDPRPDAAVIEALNDGASKVIIMPVFLTISSHTQEGIELVEALDIQVPVCIADPLWESENLQEMFVSRVNENLGETEKSEVGIMLIGHGQPEEWDLLYPTQTIQENAFRHAVKERLIRAGYAEENIVLSWMEFKTPEIADGAQELFSREIRKLMVFPASISAESIHTDIEIPAAIEEAGIPEGVDVLNLGAWNDDPHVIEGIRQNILDCGS